LPCSLRHLALFGYEALDKLGSIIANQALRPRNFLDPQVANVGQVKHIAQLNVSVRTEPEHAVNIHILHVGGQLQAANVAVQASYAGGSAIY
jgi:hypothetical protein